MIPILFEGTATDFSTNGIGRLSDAISCKVIEEKNGMYELSMQYPISGKLYSEIQNERIIVAVPFEGGSRQAFVIYEIDPNSNGTCMIYAQHISYRANYIPVLPFSVTGIQNAITALNTGIVPDTTGSRLPVANPFTITTDIENTTSRYQQEIPRSLRACLGGDEGSLLDTFATKGTGEYEWDNFNIKFHFHRGSDKGYSIRYAKNLVSLDRQLDSSDLITGVLPYWDGLYSEEGTDAVYTGDVQYADNCEDYPFKKVIPVDFSSDFDSEPTKPQLNAAGKAYVNQMAYLKDSIDLEFYDINNQAVHLCDTIHVHYTQLGVTISQKVIKTTWNVLLDRYDTITVGTDVSNLGKTLQDSIAETKQYTNSKMVAVNQRIDYEVGVIQSSISSVEGEISDGMLESIVTKYLRNNGETPDKGDENWSTTYPPEGDGTSIWSMDIYNYKGGSKVFGEPANITTNGITDVHMQYLAGTNSTPSQNDPNWSDTMPTVTGDAVLWTRYHYTYSNSTSDNSAPTKALNSLFEGINSVSSDVSNLSSTVSSNKSETDSAINGLSGDISDLSSTVSSNKSETDSAINGLSGDISDLSDTVSSNKTELSQQITNNKVTSVETQYAVTNTATAPSQDSSEWGRAYPSNVSSTQHVWERTKYTYKTGNPGYSTPTEIFNRGIATITTQYAVNNSGTTPPAKNSSSWSEKWPSSISSNQYLWKRNYYTYVDGRTPDADAGTLEMQSLVTNLTSMSGDISNLDTKIDGVETNLSGDISNLDTKIDGVESSLSGDISTVDGRVTNLTTTVNNNKVVSIETRYAKSDTAPGNTSNLWSRSYPTDIADTDHIWEQTRYKYASGTYGYSTATEITDRHAGQKITNIETRYAKTAANVTTAPENDSNLWSRDYPSSIAEGEHIWEQTKYTYASGTSEYSTPTELTDRSAGYKITGIETLYAKTTSTTAPGSTSTSWSTAYPNNATSSEHIWEMTRYQYANGNYGYSAVTELYDRGVSNVVTEYAVSTSKTSAPTTGWSTTFPSSIASNQYLWTRNKYTTLNGAADYYSTATISQNNLATQINTANSNASSAVSTANTANQNASSAVSTANTANQNASNAVSTANTANQNASNAVSTANTANQNASNAVSTANTANQNAENAVSTANEASTTATNAYNKAGEALKSTTVYYLKLSNTTTPTKDTSGWATTYPSAAFDDHIWTMTKFTYNNGTSSYSTPVEITEPDITSVTTKYILSDSNTTAPSKDDTGWQDTIPALQQGKYLWMMNVYTKSNNSTLKGTPTLAMSSLYEAVKGTLTKVETMYVTSANTATSAPSTGWSTKYPSSSESKGKKVWQKLVYTFADGHTAESAATEITESGIASVKTQYYLSTSSTTQTGGSGWVDVMPIVTEGYYLWSREVYTFHNGTSANGTATLAMNNFYQKIVNNAARITQTESDITAQATQITKISQSIGVNLTPFFSQDFTDVKGSDTQTNGYWEHALGSALKKDILGWATYDGSIANSYFSPVANLEIDSETVTILLEIDGFVKAGSTNPYIRFQNGSNNQQYQAASNFSITGDGTFLITLTRSTIASPTRLVRGLIHRGTAGDKFDIRLSMYKGTYVGDYVPYVTPADSINDYIAGVRNAQIESNALLQIQNASINSLVSQTQTIRDTYATKEEASTIASEKVSTAQSQITQTIEGVSLSVKQNTTLITELGDRYDAEVGSYFDFNTNGLDITSPNSDFTGHFDADSLDFIATSGERFGWIGAEEGVGGNQISIGEAGTNSRRWVIYPSSDGSTLRFSRVNRS